MAQQLFISASYIKDYSFIDPNIDERTIRTAALEAQKLYIRDFLGTGLYDEIVSQLGASTLTALNRTLLDDYVIPALQWWTILEAAPFLSFRFTNKNVVHKNSDSSSGVSFDELDKIMGHIKYKAQFHSQRLVDYLCENDTSYPLYINPGNGIDTVYPKHAAFDCGIYLGTKKKYTSYEERFESR